MTATTNNNNKKRVQYKRLIRDVDQASGVEAVTPNNRLNQERLAKLESIEFAWSAKNVRRSSTEPTPTTRIGGLAEGGSTGILPETNNSSKKKPSPSSPSEDGVVGVPIDARASSCSYMSDNQWDEMYQRLFEYKEKCGVSMCIIIDTVVIVSYVYWKTDFPRYFHLLLSDIYFLLILGLPDSPKVRKRYEAGGLGRNTACSLEP